MKKDQSKKLISEMKELLSGKPQKKLTLESMVFNDDYDNEDYGMYGGEDQEQQIRQGEEEQVNELPSMGGGDGEINKILSDIRLAVIKGLAKLATQPDSVEYDTLKKILVIIDKPIEKEKSMAQQQQQPNQR